MLKWKQLCARMVLCLTMAAAAAGTGLPVLGAAETEAASVKLNHTSASVFLGKTVSLKLAGTNKKVTWTTRDKKIATVTTKGVVKGVTAGKTTISAAVGTKTYKCQITVKKQLSTDKTKLVCEKERSITIHYAGRDEVSVDYSMEDPTVAALSWGDWNNSGTQIPLKIIPLSPGTTDVTVILSGTKEKLTFTITVPETIPDPDRELTSRQIYQKCSKSVAEITTYNSKEMGLKLGTGFFIDNGVLVTNYHVIEGATYIDVKTTDNKTYEVEQVLGYNKDKDIAVLKLNSQNEYLTVSTRGVETGDTVYTLGSSEGFTGTFSNGIVSMAARTIEGVDYIQITAPISNGNSGGPLLNTYGEVVGINTMGYAEGQNLNFALNIKELSKLNLSSPVAITTATGGDAASEAKTIKEDTSKSGSMTTAQTLKSQDILSGSLKPGSNQDYYKISMETAGEIVGLLASDKTSDYKNMVCELLDSKGKVVEMADNSATDLIVFNHVVKAGDYYIRISAKDSASTQEIEYILGLVTQ